MENETSNNYETANGIKSDVICRYLAIFSDGDYRQMVYVEAPDVMSAEEKLAANGWSGYVRMVKIEGALQVVYNGL